MLKSSLDKRVAWLCYDPKCYLSPKEHRHIQYIPLPVDRAVVKLISKNIDELF